MASLSLPIDSSRDHVQGPDNAPVTLVEYGDYECPYCGRAYPIVKQIQAALGDQVRFVFRNFPLGEMHPHAQHAAEAAESAGAQNKFWEMHDALYEHQKALGDSNLAHYAEQVGADANKIAADLSSGAQTERVREDFLSGVRSGVNGTPTFFINGRRHDDSYDFDVLVEAIQNALSER